MTGRDLERVARTLVTLFGRGVTLEKMPLKPNMVIAGKECAHRASPDEVAGATPRIADTMQSTRRPE